MKKILSVSLSSSQILKEPDTKLVFFFLFVSCLSRLVTPGIWDLLEQCLCISSSVSPPGQLLLSHALLDYRPHPHPHYVAPKKRRGPSSLPFVSGQFGFALFINGWLVYGFWRIPNVS